MYIALAIKLTPISIPCPFQWWYIFLALSPGSPPPLFFIHVNKIAHIKKEEGENLGMRLHFPSFLSMDPDPHEVNVYNYKKEKSLTLCQIHTW